MICSSILKKFSILVANTDTVRRIVVMNIKTGFLINRVSNRIFISIARYYPFFKKHFTFQSGCFQNCVLHVLRATLSATKYFEISSA
mgnify:CR=1 FL=1